VDHLGGREWQRRAGNEEDSNNLPNWCTVVGRRGVGFVGPKAEEARNVPPR